MIKSALLCSVLLFVSCMKFKSFEYERVLKIGDSEAITEWALSQSDLGEVVHANEALLHIADESRGLKRAKALRGFETIHSKMARGWPELDNVNRYSGKLVTSRDLAAALNYEHVALRISHPNIPDGADFRDLFKAIEPPVNDKQMHSSWEHAAKRHGVFQPQASHP